MDHTKFHYLPGRVSKKGVLSSSSTSHASPRQPIQRVTSSRWNKGAIKEIMKFHAFVLIATFALAAGQTFENCLEKDSIACVQKSLYRKAKEFFDTGDMEIFSGVSLVKSGDAQGRGSRSGKDLMYDQEIDAANNVADRQNALVNFVSDEAGEFLTGRSLKVGLWCFRGWSWSGLLLFVKRYEW